MDKFDNDTCLTFLLPDELRCTKCKRFEEKLLTNKKAARPKSLSCEQPWKPGMTAPKAMTAVSCWEYFIENKIVDNVPAEIEEIQLQNKSKRYTPEKRGAGKMNRSQRMLTTPVSVKQRSKGARFTSPLPFTEMDKSVSFGADISKDLSNMTLGDNENIVQTASSSTEESSIEFSSEKSSFERSFQESDDVKDQKIKNLEARNLKLKKEIRDLHSQLDYQKMVSKRYLHWITVLKRDVPDPAIYVKVKKSVHQQNEKAKKKLSNFFKIFKTKIFKCTNALSRRFLGEIVGMHPSISLDTAAEIVTLSRAQLCAEAGFLGKEISFDMISKSSPCYRTMANVLNETATDVLFSMYLNIFHETTVPPAIFFSCDKGTSGTFVKVLSWFRSKTNKVEQVILDVDGSIGTSEDCAKAV